MKAKDLEKAKNEFEVTYLSMQRTLADGTKENAMLSADNAVIFFLNNMNVLRELLSNAVPEEEPVAIETDQKLLDMLNGPAIGGIH